MSKIAISVMWFLAAVIICCSGILFYNFYFFDLPAVNQARALARAQKRASELNEVQLASTALNEASFSAQAGTRDARAKLVANFIERNDSNRTSPLQPYDEWGRIFVDIADEYGIDFRLLPAIARKESTFCKSNVAQTYYNCYGYGVPSAVTDAGKFSSYEEGTRVVAHALKTKYIDQGLTDPISIMRRYCPPCFAGDGTWARNLNQWLAEMRYDDKENSAALATNTDLLEFTP